MDFKVNSFITSPVTISKSLNLCRSLFPYTYYEDEEQFLHYNSKKLNF